MEAQEIESFLEERRRRRELQESLQKGWPKESCGDGQGTLGNC